MTFLFLYTFSTAPCVWVSFMDTKTHCLLFWNTLRYVVCVRACYRTVYGSLSLFYSTFPQDNEVQQQIIDRTVYFHCQVTLSTCALGRVPRVPDRGICMALEIEPIWKTYVNKQLFGENITTLSETLIFCCNVLLLPICTSHFHVRILPFLKSTVHANFTDWFPPFLLLLHFFKLNKTNNSEYEAMLWIMF